MIGQDELATRIAEREGIAPSDAARLIDRAVDAIVRTLLAEGSWEAPGVGTFTLRLREGRGTPRTPVAFRDEANPASSKSASHEEAAILLAAVTEALAVSRVVELPRLGLFLREKSPERIVFSVAPELRAAALAAK